ncbi:hypothetical protein [Photobacterium rosenbergii]|uniref:hypothetical protein n=1 Tax=Photobacterium rosenbergii TaxID=294936 RepID=UPI001C98F688|nr:hypothetical protein [Photobacterium rosenbergii]MBY5948402.1 hypothetical protein [Photobacterium rosenbergii]
MPCTIKTTRFPASIIKKLMRRSKGGRLITTLLIMFLLPFDVQASSTPRYSKVDLDMRGIYTTKTFPYEDYFVCIRKNAPVLAHYIATDQLYRKALSTVAGEISAVFYRYFNGLPEKERFREPDMQEFRPKKQQVPFYDNKTYLYPYTYIDGRKRNYQYDMKAYDLKKELWNRSGGNRHWILTQMTFYERAGDYELKPIKSIDNLMIMISINMKDIRASKSEEDAFNKGYNNLNLYYFSSSSEHCK